MAAESSEIRPLSTAPCRKGKCISRLRSSPRCSLAEAYFVDGYDNGPGAFGD